MTPIQAFHGMAHASRSIFLCKAFDAEVPRGDSMAHGEKQLVCLNVSLQQ